MSNNFEFELTEGVDYHICDHIGCNVHLFFNPESSDYNKNDTEFYVLRKPCRCSCHGSTHACTKHRRSGVRCNCRKEHPEKYEQSIKRHREFEDKQKKQKSLRAENERLKKRLKQLESE